MLRRAFPPNGHIRRRFPVAGVPPRRAFPPKVARFEAPPFWGSVYQRWAAGFFVREVWKVLPFIDPDDLIQMAYFKYDRCVTLYVIQRGTCTTEPNLMSLFKQACARMVIDESRKKSRRCDGYLQTDLSAIEYLEQNQLDDPFHMIESWDPSDQLERTTHHGI